MIASIRGNVTYKNESFMVVETGGIGFKVFVTAQACATTQEGSPIFLHTHQITREDGMYLYGFEKIEERDLFIQIISVSGIGPKLGMAMLTALSAEAIQRAVMQEQDAVFSNVPGIGQKTAKKIILLLKDKIQPLLGEVGYEMIPDADTDILQALVGLGYSLQDAQKAVTSIPKDASEDAGERLRIALQYFST